MKKEHNIARKIYPEKTVERIEEKIKLLGMNCNYKVMDLLNYRLILGIILFITSLFYFKNGYILAPILTILFYCGSEIILLDLPIQKRSKKLEQEAIFFFEVLALTLEGGRNLNTALQITSKNIDSELSKEFQKSLQEVHLGKSFTECLNDMKMRIPSDTINNVILNITQSSIFGNSILESLNNQLDYLKEKRLLEIKAEITKLPTKISVISVLFFIPIMLLIILAPVLLEFIFG